MTAEKPFTRLCRDIAELKSYNEYSTHATTIFSLIRNIMVYTFDLGRSDRALVEMLIEEDVLSKCTAVLNQYEVHELVLRSTSSISSMILNTVTDLHNPQILLGISAAMKLVISQTKKNHMKKLDLLADICRTLDNSRCIVEGSQFLNFATSLVGDGSVFATSIMVGLHHQDPSSNNRLLEEWIHFLSAARFPGKVTGKPTVGMKEIRPIICSMSNYIRDYTKTKAITVDSVIYKSVYLLQHIAEFGNEKDLKTLLKHQFIKKLAMLVLDGTDLLENISVTGRFIHVCYLMSPCILSKKERGIVTKSGEFGLKTNLKEFKPILGYLPVLMCNELQNEQGIFLRDTSFRILNDIVMSGKTTEDLMKNFLPSGSFIIKALLKLWLYKPEEDWEKQSVNRIVILTLLERLINPSNCTTSDFVLKVLNFLKPTFCIITHYLSSSSSSKVIADNKEKADVRVIFLIFRYLKSIASQICKLQQENIDGSEITKTIMECGLVDAISKVASDYIDCVCAKTYRRS